MPPALMSYCSLGSMLVAVHGSILVVALGSMLVAVLGSMLVLLETVLG